MRIAVIFLAVLAAIVSISPIFVGSRIESAVQDYVGLYDDIPVYKVAIDDYDKGYRSSVATISVGVDSAIFEAMAQANGLPTDMEPFTQATEGLKFQVNIQHGPILTEHGFGLGWSDISMHIDRENYPQLSGIFDLIGTDELLNFIARVELSGAGWGRSEVSDIHMEIPSEIGGIKFVMAGINGDVRFSDFGANIEEQGSIDEISFSLNAEQAVSMSLKGMTYDAEMSIGNPIWLSMGNFEGDIESIVFDVADEFEMELADTSFEVAIEEGESPETMTIREAIRFENASFNEHKVTNADLSFAYANISKAFWTSYMDMAMSPEVLAGGEGAEAYVMEKLKSMATDALGYSPRFDLERVAFEYEGGTMDASASFGIDSNLLAQPINFENPMLLIPAMKAEASLTINETLLRTFALMNAQGELEGVPEEERPGDEQIQQMIDGQLGMLSGPLAEQGYVVINGDVYSADFSFSRGIALVNGNPIPLPF